MARSRRRWLIAAVIAAVVAIGAVGVAWWNMWDVTPCPWEVPGRAGIAHAWGYPLARVVGGWTGHRRYAQQRAEGFTLCYWEEPTEVAAAALFTQLHRPIPFSGNTVEYSPGLPDGGALGDESYWLTDPEWGARLVVRSGRYVAFAWGAGWKESHPDPGDPDAELAMMVRALGVFARRAR